MSKLADLVVGDSLVAAVRSGDRDAAGRLYAKVAGPAYTLARRLVGSAVAEYVLQDSIVRMFAALGSFRGEAPFGSWLRRIVVTQCLMQLRSPWRRARVYWEDCGDSAVELTNSIDPSVAVDAERALRRLTPTARPHSASGLHPTITPLLRRASRLRSGARSLASVSALRPWPRSLSRC